MEAAAVPGCMDPPRGVTVALFPVAFFTGFFFFLLADPAFDPEAPDSSSLSSGPNPPGTFTAGLGIRGAGGGGSGFSGRESCRVGFFFLGCFFWVVEGRFSSDCAGAGRTSM